MLDPAGYPQWLDSLWPQPNLLNLLEQHSVQPFLQLTLLLHHHRLVQLLQQLHLLVLQQILQPLGGVQGVPLRGVQLHLVQLHVGQSLCAGDAHGCLRQLRVQLQLWGCELSQGQGRLVSLLRPSGKRTW